MFCILVLRIEGSIESLLLASNDPVRVQRLLNTYSAPMYHVNFLRDAYVITRGNLCARKNRDRRRFGL